MSHRNAVELLHSCQQMYGFGPQDTWSLFHSSAFDFSIWEIWGAWLHGGTLVLVPTEIARNPEAFSRLLREQSVTVLSQTPSAFYQLAEWVLRSQESIPSLQVVIFGGEALDVRRLQGWTERFGFDQPRFVNMYGITETTIHVSYCPLTERSCREAVGSIGKSLPGVRMALRDSGGGTLPLGAIAELHVGGVGVSRGYIGRPGATASRFLPDPQGAPGARCFRSGDLGRMRSDDSLQYLGRLDRQVQLRGHRVELDEITYHLCQHESIASAVVLVAPEEQTMQGGGQRLLAYLKWQPNSEKDKAALRSYLRERLPAYMLPSEFISVSEIPMNRNNKVDVSALLRLRETELETSFGFARTGIEQIVAEIWSECLGRENLSVFANFFDIGGHSLLAIQVMEQLRAQLGTTLPLTSIFQTPTISSLSQAIVEQSDDKMGRSVTLEQGSGQKKVRLYCIHPGGGHVRGYQPLAASLCNGGWAIQGIQSRAVIDGAWKADSLASMAREYAALILSECLVTQVEEKVSENGETSPALPIGLVGWSMGGVLALEVTAILERKGWKVAFVGVIDAPLMQLPLDEFEAVVEEVDAFPKQLIEEYAIKIGLELQSESFRRLSAERGASLTSALIQARDEDQKLTLVLEAAKSLELVPKSYSLELCKWRIGILEEAKALVSDHRPSMLRQDIHVWIAQSDSGESDVRRRLGKFVSGKINIKSVAANHTEIVQSESVVQGIRSCLQRAEKRWNAVPTPASTSVPTPVSIPVPGDAKTKVFSIVNQE